MRSSGAILPPIVWGPRDPKAPYPPYLAANPLWDMSRRPDAPQKKAILQARDHLLAMNPDLPVVGAHLGSMEDDLDGLATRFELYPNFAVDIAARVRKLRNLPRDKVRAFLLKYQDRILYGTDLRFDAGTTDQAASHGMGEPICSGLALFCHRRHFRLQGARSRRAESSALGSQEVVPRQRGPLDSRRCRHATLRYPPGVPGKFHSLNPRAGTRRVGRSSLGA